MPTTTTTTTTSTTSTTETTASPATSSATSPATSPAVSSAMSFGATTTTEVTTTALTVTITATTPIDAPATVVWAVLSDTDAYPEWNPFVRALRGPLAVGRRVEVELQLPGRKLRTMRPRITAVDEGRSFEWLGRVGVPRLFDGRHRFEVIADGADRCTLVQHERLSGLLVPVVRSLLTGATPEGFTSLNEALEARAADPQRHRAH
jgi:hypothetical protein